MSGVLFALLSALIWGSADFCGGLATRRLRPFPVTALASLAGMAVLILLVYLQGEAWPSMADTGWATAAGVCGGLGLAALYRGLAQGNASLVAPVAALTGAALPLLVGIILEGWPALIQTAGLLVGLAGIWFVSRPAGEQQTEKRAGLGTAVLAGLFFGGFFVLIAQADHNLIFSPLAVVKATEMVLALMIIRIRRDPMPSLSGPPLALLAGVLDDGGNVFFLLARQHTRLDIAAILASMYPASTVLLSMFILREKISRTQWLGLLLCLVALALIAA